MKLLIVANYAKEHINKFHLSTIAKFRDAGWQVDVACNADAPVEGACHVYHLPCERNPFRPQTLTCVRQLKKIIAENGYDALHCHTLCGRVIGTLAAKPFRKRGLKLIVTYHGLNYYRGSSMTSKLLIPMDRLLVRYADLAFSDNREDLNFMQTHGYRLPTCVFCPPSVKIEKFADAADFRAQRAETRREFGLAVDASVLTYVAELNDNKNQLLLLNALPLLREKFPEIRLLLVGPDHSDGKIAREIERRGLRDFVICTGWRNDICRLMTACDIYTATSIREGFGINLIEAALCSLPIVATNNRGHREIITDGENGFLIPTDDPNVLAERVERLLRDADLRNALVQRGEEILRERFGEKMEDTIFRAYQSLF